MYVLMAGFIILKVNNSCIPISYFNRLKFIAEHFMANNHFILKQYTYYAINSTEIRFSSENSKLASKGVSFLLQASTMIQTIYRSMRNDSKDIKRYIVKQTVDLLTYIKLGPGRMKTTKK